MKLLKELNASVAISDQLNEVDLEPFKAFGRGWNDAKSRHQNAKDKAEQKAKDAEQKVKDDAEAERLANDPNAKPFDKNDVLDDMHIYLTNFFTEFPNYGEGGAEYFLKTYPQDAARELAATTFEKLAKRITQLKDGFNKSLVSSGRLDATQIKPIEAEGKKQMSETAPPLAQPLIDFVKRENQFFRNLIKINSAGEIDEGVFKTLLGKKVANTGPTRIADAATALNILFGFMSAEFLANAKHLEKAGDARDAENRDKRLLNRTTNQNPEG